MNTRSSGMPCHAVGVLCCSPGALECRAVWVLCHSLRILSLQMSAVELRRRSPTRAWQTLLRRGTCPGPECTISVKGTLRWRVQITSFVQMVNGQKPQFAEVGVCAFTLPVSIEATSSLLKYSEDFAFFTCSLWLPQLWTCYCFLLQKFN